MIYCIVSGLVLLVVYIVLLFFSEKFDALNLSMWSFIIGASLMACVVSYFIIQEPSAIEVYRGNTTLKVSYIDGVPTDSVVVFKNKE